MRAIYILNLMIILIFSITSAAYAVDGMILINQATESQGLEYQNQLLGQKQLEQVLFKFENQESHLNDTALLTDRNTVFFEPYELQKKLAEEHEQEVADYALLTNKFYENDRIRVFNYTAYNVQQLKTSLLNPSSNNPAESELYISFGYGVEFKINALNKIGYEYISSFPYDRGQLLRLFWIRTLTY